MKRYKGDKGKAWDAVKHYIRERDKWMCTTCGKNIEKTQDAHAGHFIPMSVCGSNNHLGWDERNIHLQCYKCNVNYGGWGERYAEVLENKYGRKVVENLRNRRHLIDPVKDWKAIEEEYKQKLKDL